MAMNQRYTHFDHIALTVPDGVKSGQPVRVGAIAGVAQIDRQPDGKATVWLDGSHMVDVAGALTEGQVVYIKADRTLTATATGNYPFGVAVTAIGVLLSIGSGPVPSSGADSMPVPVAIMQVPPVKVAATVAS